MIFMVRSEAEWMYIKTWIPGPCIMDYAPVDHIPKIFEDEFLLEV